MIIFTIFLGHQNPGRDHYLLCFNFSFILELPYHASLWHGVVAWTKTMVSTLLSVIIFTGRPFPPPHPTFMGARGTHKRHQRYNYSYHRVQNSYQILRKSWFDTNIGLLLFLHVIPFQPSPSLLRVYLNSIGNVTIPTNVPKNYEFHTNVGRLRLFLQT